MSSPARPQLERVSLKGRTIFGTGFSSGTGLETAVTLAEAGADLIALTRDPQKFLRDAAPEFEKRIPGFGADNIFTAPPRKGASRLYGKSHPAVYIIQGGLGDPDGVVSGVQNLYNAGILATDFVHLGAGGMEEYSRHAAVGLLRIGKIPAEDQEKRAAAKADFRARSQLWVAQNWDNAMQVNFHGPVALAEALPNLMADGEKKLINFSSWPSTFLGVVEAWEFYLTIAGSKGRLHQWIVKNFEKLVEASIKPKTLSAPIIGELNPETGKGTGRGTEVGDILLVTLPPLLSEVDGTALKNTAIIKQQAAVAIRALLIEDTSGWIKDNATVFIIGPDGRVTTDLNPNSPGVNIKLGV